MNSPQHDQGAVASIVDDIRIKLRGLLARISTELPAHISLHNTKQAIEDAVAAISHHPTQRKEPTSRPHPNLDEQSDEVNLRKTGHLAESEPAAAEQALPGLNKPAT